MATGSFLIEKLVPGADACILIGRCSTEGASPPGRWRRRLWLVDAGGVTPSPAGAEWAVLNLDRCSAPELEAAVSQFFAQSPKFLPSLFVTSDLPTALQAQYGAAIDCVAAVFESQQRTRITRQKDAFAWQSYLLQNLSEYAQHRLPDEWAGALAGLPAFVCGAGPSLKVSVASLARFAANGVVFAADSSLRALAGAGVNADFAVSVDVAKVPEKCFPDSGLSARCVLAATSPPAWSDAIPAARRFYVSSHQITLDWLAALGVVRPKVGVCENCGATAIELARFLGCAPIYLFGMDLALDAQNLQRHHDAVEKSLYQESGFNAEQQFPTVPGNFSPEVPTHVIGDWRALDQRLATWPQGLVSVVTDRGARLSNTRVVRPDDFQVPVSGETKETVLGRLANARAASVRPLRLAADKLEPFGRRLSDWTPLLRKSLKSNGAEAVAGDLRTLFAKPENGQMLGAYALKLMPLLLPPIDPNPGSWGAMLGELETLGAHARHAAAALQKLAERIQ